MNKNVNWYKIMPMLYHIMSDNYDSEYGLSIEINPSS